MSKLIPLMTPFYLALVVFTPIEFSVAGLVIAIFAEILHFIW